MTPSRALVVTIPGMIDEQDLAPLREQSEVSYRELDSVTETELSSMCSGFDYLMLNYDVVKKLTPSFYSADAVKSLNAISADITGMDWASPEAAKERGVRLLNIPHYSTESVAETCVAEVFLHARQRHLAYLDALKGRDIEDRKGINLLGKTAGVVGVGSIGSRVVELLAGVGMDVIGWNRTPKNPLRNVSLDELFGQSQVICVCLKTVREGEGQNVGFIDGRLLEQCQGAIVVNLANRDLVDDSAMVEALRTGKVAAYTVEHSPELEQVYADWEQVHLAPHNSWLSDESLQMLRHVWVRNILDAIDGRFPNLVEV